MLTRVSLGLFCASCFLTALQLLQSLIIWDHRQAIAFKGNAAAAKRLILPCYRPFFRALIVFYLIIALILGISIFEDYCYKTIFFEIQYACFGIVVLLFIVPLLLIQKSISYSSFWRVFYTILPWWIICTAFWILSVVTSFHVTFQILFLLSVSLPTYSLSIGILGKFISSRVQIGSVSNRNAIELCIIAVTVFVVGTSGCISVFNGSHYQSPFQYLTLFLILSFSIVSFLFPFALYRTLLADTKYWRGMGKHNQGGIRFSEQITNGDAPRPSIDMSTAATSFQDMLSDMNDYAVDFAFVQVDKKIGEGASSEVYSGKFGKDPIAIKISSPPEITSEVLDVFVKEAKISTLFQHRQIVKFYGICVRPPQIGMVMELCGGGNLKRSLTRQPTSWTPVKRLQACWDASCAVAFIHSRGILHRDIKAENFFVGEDGTVKLGDFGESSFIRTEESTVEQRMTIVGTVAYMAPELIEGKRYYTSAIDIYALAITWWEIWTGKNPYEELDTFKVYQHVEQGNRPLLPLEMPKDLQSVVEEAWKQVPSDRLTGKECVDKLSQIAKDLYDQEWINQDKMQRRGTNAADANENSSRLKGNRRFSLARLSLKVKQILLKDNEINEEDEDHYEEKDDVVNSNTEDIENGTNAKAVEMHIIQNPLQHESKG